MKTLAALINQAYPSPEWAVFFEVSNTTGFGASRRADAIALGIWPSRGNAVIGFEFKEDRRDWLREKKNPAKADLIAANCDRWYVVAGHADVVKLGELPEPWGLLVASTNREKLTTLKPAVPFPDRDTTVMKRAFVASMLRKVTETTIPLATLQARVDQEVAAKLAVHASGREQRFLEQQNKELTELITDFKKRTGVDLKSYEGIGRISAAVDAVLHADRDRLNLEHTKTTLERAAADIGKALDVWPSAGASV